jgi:hypothetical protein
MAESAPTSTPAGPYDALLLTELRAFEAEGKPAGKIQMIKALRTQTGIGLREAKFAVENFGVRYGIESLVHPPAGSAVTLLIGGLILLAGLLAFALFASR